MTITILHIFLCGISRGHNITGHVGLFICATPGISHDRTVSYFSLIVERYSIWRIAELYAVKSATIFFTCHYRGRPRRSECEISGDILSGVFLILNFDSSS